MFSTLVSAAALSLLAVRGARAADFTVNSTDFTQCGQAHITWSGTSKPVNILLVPADSPCDETLFDLGDHTKSSMSWNVTMPAGTEFYISVEDADGEEAWSDPITVASSSDNSCLSASQRAAAASASASVNTTTSSVSTTSSTTSSGSSSGSGSAAGEAIGAVNAGVGPKASGAAPRALPALALAGSLAAAAAALF